MARLAVIGSPYTTIPEVRNRKMFNLQHLSEHLSKNPDIIVAEGFERPWELCGWGSSPWRVTQDKLVRDKE